jgi:S-formylglutathione hydrolase FrmB
MIAAMLALHLGLVAEEQMTVSQAQRDPNGYLVHEVRSPYQADKTLIQVLMPDESDGASYSVIYVLPVEDKLQRKYGSGLDEIKKLDLQNKHRVIFVAPTFADLPWYADHPAKPELKQESYFVDVVVPFIDKTYPVRAEAGGRLLLGFSKSGWGAFALLLRHPAMFGRAAAWDAPLMMDKPGRFGSGEIFGTSENFERYRISSLLEANADRLQDEQRLLLLGYGNFHADHEAAHALMDKLHIAHEYRDGPARRHHWDSGWLPEAVELLIE